MTDSLNPAAPEDDAGDDPFAARLAMRKASGEDVTNVSLGERFMRNMRAGYEGSLTGAARSLSDAIGGIQPTDDYGRPVGPAPSPEAIAASIEDRRAAAALYEATPGFGGPLEAGAALAGQIAGSLVSPESWITRVPGVASIVERLAGRAGGEVVGRTAGAAASQAVVAGGADPLVQGAQIAAGDKEHYSGTETALHALLGAGVGAIVHGAGEGVQAIAKKKSPAALRKEAEQIAQVEQQATVAAAAEHTAIQDERAALAAEDPALKGEAEAYSPEVRAAAAETVANVAGVSREEAERLVDQVAAEASGGTHSAPPVIEASTPAPAGVSGQTADAGEALTASGTAQGRLQEPIHAVAQASREAAKQAATAPEKLPAFTDKIEALTEKTYKTDKTPTPDAPAGVFLFDASKLNTDAARFQYKDNGDAEGVTHALKGITKWDPAKANQLIVWQDNAGKLFVADGHQRSGLARRLLAQGHEQGIQIPGILYREADGFSSQDVRAIAAAKNIAEGSGSPIDGAKVLRDRPELLDGSMPISRTEARQSFELARLSDEAFKLVTNEVVPYQQAAVVGRLIPEDGPRQVAAMEALARFEPRNETEATVLVQRVAQAELEKRAEGAQSSMFGDLMGAESTAGEEMKIVAKAIGELKKDKALFTRVVSNADRIEESGSSIERGSAKAVAADAELFAKLIASDAYSAGPMREALTSAARDLKNGQRTLADAVRGVLDAARREAESHVLGRARDSGGTGGSTAVTEAGAEGLPQTVLPGAERVSQGEQAQRAADKPLQAPAAQNFDTSGLALFGDSHKQDALQFRKRPAGQPEKPGAGGTGEAPGEPLLTPQQQSAQIAQDLDLTLRQGRVRGGKDVAGQFDAAQDVARVQKITDIPTVTHEAAHGLEKDIPALRAFLQQHKGELAPLDYDPTRGNLSEGFAEYLRMFVEAPAAASKAAPQFEQAFRAFMAEHGPEALAAFERARDAYAAFQNAPSGAKLSALVKRQEPEGFWQTVREEGLPRTISLYVGRAYESLLDDKAPAAQAVRSIMREVYKATGVRQRLEGSDNPENLVRTFSRSAQAGVRDMLDGVRPYRSVTPEGPSLRDALIKATGNPGIFGRWDDEAMKAFSDYLVARRAAVLWTKYDTGNLSARPLAMSKADVLQALGELEAAHPAFVEASQMVHDYTRQLLRKMWEGGLIERELYDKLQAEQFYVPLMRDMRDKAQAAGAGIGGGTPDGPGKANLIKRMRGSDRDIIDPVQSIMTQTFLVNRTLAHNEIIRAFVGLARRARKAGAENVGRILEEVPAHEITGTKVDVGEAVRNAARTAGIDETDTAVLVGALADTFGEDPIIGTIFRAEPTGKRGEPITFWKEGGELKAVRIISKDEGLGLYEALSALPPQAQDIAVQLGAASASILRAGIVTNPTFAITNFVRDQMAAAILRPDYIPFDPRGVAREVLQKPAAQLYTYAGGVSPGAGSAGLQDFISRDVEALARKGWLVQKVGGIGDLLTKGDIKAGAKAIGEFVEVSEAGTRLNVFQRVFEQKKAQGLSEYDAMIEAASQATDLLDFGRHGARLPALRGLVPFLNAHIQSLDKARRVLIEPITRAMRGDMVTEADVSALKNAGLSWFKMAGVGGALGYLYSTLMADHDAYRDANDELRATHLIIPGDAVGRPGKVVVVPKPFELALGFNLGEMLGLGIQTGDPRVAKFARAGAWEVLAPPNVAESIPLLKTWAELKLGKSFFTGRDIVPERLQSLAPGEQFIPGKTSSIARTIGQAINVSPIKVDYAIGSTFGMWGKDLLAAANTADPSSPAAALEDTMFLRRFIKSADVGSETTKQFWDMAGQKNGRYAQDKNTYEAMLGQFRDADAQAFLAKLSEPERAYVVLHSAGDSETGKVKFSADEKRMHPLVRAATAVNTLGGYIRELGIDAQRELESGQQVAMDPTKRRQVIDALRVLSAMEQRNAMVMMREPGYADRKLLSTEDQFKVLQAMDPKVAAEVATRYATAKIQPLAEVAKAWPEAQKRLLNDGGDADLSDLITTDDYEFGGERVRKAPKRRVPIPAPTRSIPEPQPMPQRRSSLPQPEGLNVV